MIFSLRVNKRVYILRDRSLCCLQSFTAHPMYQLPDGLVGAALLIRVSSLEATDRAVSRTYPIPSQQLQSR